MGTDRLFSLFTFAISSLYEFRMNSAALLVLVAAGLSAANGLLFGDIIQGGNANEYADQLLKKLRVRILNQGLDPLILPVKSFEFTRRFSWSKSAALPRSMTVT